MSVDEPLRAPAPRRTLTSALWGRIFHAICGRLAFGSLLVRLPDGRAQPFRGRFPGNSAELHVLRPGAFLMRVATRGDLGFAESYLEGHWTSPDLPALLDLLLHNAEHLQGGYQGMRLSRLVDRLSHALRRNHRRNSRRNIARHYDLGNDFYRLWLDPGMTYSAALFDRTGDDAPAHQDLEQAQARKYEAAVQRGLRVTAVTLSKAQLAYARERIDRAGLADLVEFRLQDYRDITGQFDHAISIEMLEAVGEAYWPTYFEALRRLVRPGGRIGLQVITIHPDDFETYRRTADFIQLYVFPGGMLPSPGRLLGCVRDAGLELLEERWQGADYAETLRRWRDAFQRSQEQVARLGYDPVFRRMWDYYLAYCEVGFDCGAVDLAQLRLQVPRSGA